MREKNYFVKHRIVPDNISYIYRRGPKSIVHLVDGRESENYHPLKNLMDDLPENKFWSINKSVIVAVAQVESIDRLTYTMKDGTTFLGRVRNAGEHNRNAKTLSRLAAGETERETGSGLRIMPVNYEPANSVSGMLKQFAIFDEMPIAFCIIELIFDKNGHGMDFVFRYCNKEMANLEGVPVEQMIDRSFYEVFRNGDPKWLLTYGDVALNKVTRVITAFSPEIGKELSIYCFCPMENYCACALIAR
ncbi:MAG: LytTR family transcriptional regulator DNA-binding domain-containing protein [Selenomonadaceae bacterium]|nr:LytTR family transcriptional regulator DNA-binding domain-containing protein [Selenomonadaceae bacterium]